MSHANLALLVLLAAVVAGSQLPAVAHADDEAFAQPLREGAPRSDLRTGLTQQLADEAASIERAITIVGEKLAALDGIRTRRLAAAYRVLRAPAGHDLRATARRRAAARLLVERDLAERGLLADEHGQLRTAKTRTTGDAARVPAIVLPAQIARPAKGAIARRFGLLDHERSNTKLSRRGLDLEVAEHAPATAVADGIVRYAGPMRGLDSGVIVDHGSYLSVVAKLAASTVPVGAPVKRGDRLGNAARQRIYLEIRVAIGPGGLPIDPEPLFAAAR